VITTSQLSKKLYNQHPYEIASRSLTITKWHFTLVGVLANSCCCSCCFRCCKRANGAYKKLRIMNILYNSILHFRSDLFWLYSMYFPYVLLSTFYNVFLYLTFLLYIRSLIQYHDRLIFSFLYNT
jgi:hypothetical protein